MAAHRISQVRTTQDWEDDILRIETALRARREPATDERLVQTEEAPRGHDYRWVAVAAVLLLSTALVGPLLL